MTASRRHLCRYCRYGRNGSPHPRHSGHTGHRGQKVFPCARVRESGREGAIHKGRTEHDEVLADGDRRKDPVRRMGCAARQWAVWVGWS